MTEPKPQEPSIRLEVVCDGATGHVFAARSLDQQATGEDAPDQVCFEAEQGQVCEVVDITPEQAGLGPSRLFATHRVSQGRLVPDEGCEQGG